MFKVIELLIDPTPSGETGVFEVAWVENPAIEQDFMYFSEQKFYKAPDYVAAKACQAIKENEKRGNPAGTQVGKIRAQQLCNQTDISLETIKRMKSFLSRAATYDTGDWDDNGTIAMGLWGGKEALTWVNKILNQEENMGIQDFVYPSAGETKDEFISRCIAYVIKEGKTEDEAAGQCYGMWENQNFAEVGERGGIKESDKAPKSKTPNPNPKGEGSAKGDASTTRGAVVTQEVEDILKKKSDDFNERYKDKLGYGVNVGTLKTVYQRGVGAYNTSHSPEVKSSQQWGLARVNAFLYLVKEGRPQNAKYTTDYDLLPSGHPKKDKMSEDFAVGVPHYTKDGELYEGPTHEHNGRLMTGAVHTDDSEYLYHEGEYAIGDKVSFDWDDTLDTKNGRKLLEQEMSRGSLIYIISARNITTKEMIDLATKYGFPASHIYTTGSNKAKVEKIKELGIKRHYDNNLRVIQDLGPVGIKFDYELLLPPYDNYPASGDTDAMLIEPELFSCGCDSHEEDFEWTEEDLVMKAEFAKLKESMTQEEFEAVTNPLLRGFTETEIYGMNHPNPTKYFQYKRKLTGSPDREFCMSIENRWFRRAQIDALRDSNRQFGHNREAYSKWLFKGGPQCVHAWYGALFQGKNRADQGYAEGRAGQAPQELVGKGYYPGTPRYKANLSQQNMSSVSLMDEKQIECAFGDLCSFALENKGQSFAALQEKRMIYTPLMIPNILIPRIDEVSQEKYYVKFTPETIEKIAQKFMIEQRLRDTNLEHTDKKFSDIAMVESWIIEGEKDKAYELGFSPSDLPPGTWMGGYKVLDTPEGNFVWDNYIKKGKVKGASVEGNFILNFSVQKTDDYLLSQIINILQQIQD